MEGADTLSASFIDNSVYEATIKGTDSDNDLAVIAVPLSSISDDTMSQIAVAAVGDSDSLKVGEQVVTSYVSDRFVQGLFIGYISEINVDSNNLTRSGYITPAVDFSKIQEVLVLTKTKEDMTNGADDESASDTAKGE